MTQRNDNKFQYKATIIVPNYNMGEYLPRCIKSLLEQTIDKSKMEILLIDDGSHDNSVEIMNHFALENPCIKVFSKENEGLSATRNYGIRRAQGKYIFYLDADDILGPETVKSVIDFFEKHYNEIDIVSYPESRINKNSEVSVHYRYKVLNKSGIYDLNKIENAFTAQTRINVCVKNVFDDNILFDPDMQYHEDQQYCNAVLRPKMKLGFCNKGEYIYIQHTDSIVGKYFYSYYIFEYAMRYWEEEFKFYDGKKVPYYIQAGYLNDISWKTVSDNLIPYHYNDEQLQIAKKRILRLLDKVEDIVILNHPEVDNFHKHYFINLKSNNRLNILKSPLGIYVTNHDTIIYELKKFRIALRDFKVYDNKIKIVAFIKSALFNYIDQQPKLYLIRNDNVSSPERVDVRLSSWSYYRAKTITNYFWLFNITIETTNLKSFEFKVEFDNELYKCNYTFSPKLYFNRQYKRFKYYRKDKEYSFSNGVFHIKNINTSDYKKWLKKVRRQFWDTDKRKWLLRNLCLYKSKAFENVWLYYDCHGVGRDNAYYQFDYDFKKNDGVSRYYILNEDNFNELRNTFPSNQRRHIVKFGSPFHKFLYLKACKIITAFIEPYNHFPFEDKDFQSYAEVNNQKEIIYLQHGVLHAHQPWKYSLDRLNGLDREVISTPFERENLTKNYCFTDDSLIPCGMPRYDYIDEKLKPINRILFAPSWRKYLINQLSAGWEGIDEHFVQSQFYKETMAFLNSPKLQTLLEKYDFYLDFKLHPIFQCYNHLYNITNDRVTLAEKHITETQYKIFMTDFSSFVFDFVYLKRPIIYFLPDKEMFTAGMAIYRELDLPFEDAFGDLTCNSDEAIDALEQILNNKCSPAKKYQDRMENFFFYKDNCQRERLYNALIKDIH